jgi:uncharacterized protein (DUF697 family)/tellurite resistance protein
MTESDREAIATIALIAALADGARGAEEERQLGQIASTIGSDQDVGFDLIARKVLSGQSPLDQVAARLSDDGARRQAYEMAVLVCHADGSANEKEKAFLKELERILRVDQGAAVEVSGAATALAVAPLSGPAPEAPAAPASPSPRVSQAGLPAVNRDTALDDMILKNAMLAGALELLPQNVAAAAIVPVQLRLVYRIGADFGQKLDRSQIMDLLGAVGIGAVGQVMEGVARRVLGGVAKGLLGRLVGGVAGGVAGAAAGVGLTFATTYALGHAAKQYYAQGRRLSRDDLRTLFGRLREEAGTIYPRVEAQIRSQASTLDLRQVMSRLRGPA